MRARTQKEAQNDDFPTIYLCDYGNVRVMPPALLLVLPVTTVHLVCSHGCAGKEASTYTSCVKT
jgi:hypothetical protein